MRSISRKICTTIGFIVLAVYSFCQNGHQPDKKIVLRLEFPLSRQENIVNAKKEDSTFDIKLIIKNNTDTLASFYEDWNAWGFYNIAFQLKIRDTMLLLRRAGGCWDKNFPSSIMLFPGDSVVFFYDIQECTRKICDCFLGTPKGLLNDISIRAVYELQKENHEDIIKHVLEDGELRLSMYSSHREQFEKLSTKQKIKSYVTDQLHSEYYRINFPVNK